MKRVMVDIETLGSRPGSVVLSIGACTFGADGVGEQFYRALDVLDSVMYGLTLDADTVAWWRDQAPEARGALRPQVRLLDGLADFKRFVADADEVWAKGPDFDLVLLGEVYIRATGQRPPWKYRNARDVRTILALVGDSPRAANEAKHHALADALAQAEDVRAALVKLVPA